MNKVAFITGAGGYIGGQTALTLAKQGISVAVCDLNLETVNRTVEMIETAGGVAKAYVADVTESASIGEAINSAAEYFGRLDIMIHIAG
jgi:NAD(P)-dependent dehydrogenase (short-subunit alcohol dehydrogenase family)